MGWQESNTRSGKAAVSFLSVMLSAACIILQGVLLCWITVSLHTLCKQDACCLACQVQL